MIFSWLERRTKERQLIASDAAAIIEQFGDAAYAEARAWVIAELNYKVIDADRPPGHWARVRAEVRRRTKPQANLDTATRYLEGPNGPDQ